MTSKAVEQFETLDCTRCGYSLRTLDRDGVCPECGQVVAASIEEVAQREATFGPPLRDHSATWLWAAASGFFVFLAGGSVIICADLSTSPPSRAWMVIAGRAMSLLGVWLFTIRPIEPKTRGEALRWITRIVLTIWFIANAISDIGMAVLDRAVGGDARMWTALSSCAIGTLTGFLYLAHLAGRMRRLLVRRVFLTLSIIPILMILALLKTSHGVFLPTLFGFELPWPVYPFTAQAEELIHIRYALNNVLAGRVSWVYFFKSVLPIFTASVASISAMLWYGMILIGIGSRRAEREALRRTYDARK
jgi:hypothetical protein